MVDLKLILSGYDHAFARLQEGRNLAKKEDDSLRLFIPLVETLGWADVIEEWMQKNHGKDWVKKLPSPVSDLEKIILGFRYARNVVHHNWSIAVELDDQPGVFKDWRWKDHLLTAKSQPTNKAAYESSLAGRALRHTFKDLHKLYLAAERI